MPNYMNPEDLPIPFSAIDPLSSELIYGDDKPDELLERRNEAPSPDHDFNFGKEAAVTRSALDRMAKEIEAELPQHSMRIKRYIARIKAAMALGMSSEELHMMFYGGKKMADPIRLAALGYEPEARFIQEPSADVAGPVDSGKEEELEEELDKDVPEEAKGEGGEPADSAEEGVEAPPSDDVDDVPEEGEASEKDAMYLNGKDLSRFDWLVEAENIDPLAQPSGQPETGLKQGDQVSMGGAGGEITQTNADGTATAHFTQGDMPDVTFNDQALETGTVKRSSKGELAKDFPIQDEELQGIDDSAAWRLLKKHFDYKWLLSTHYVEDMRNGIIYKVDVKNPKCLFELSSYQEGTGALDPISDESYQQYLKTGKLPHSEALETGTVKRSTVNGNPIANGNLNKLRSPETAKEEGMVTRVANMGGQRAPNGMQTDPETGEMKPGDDLMGLEQPKEDEKIAFVLTFSNLPQRQYSKLPFFLENWLPDIKTALVREGGELQGGDTLHSLVAKFRTETAARRFANRLRSEFYVPEKFVSLAAVQGAKMASTLDGVESVILEFPNYTQKERCLAYLEMLRGADPLFKDLTILTDISSLEVAHFPDGFNLSEIAAKYGGEVKTASVRKRASDDLASLLRQTADVIANDEGHPSEDAMSDESQSEFEMVTDQLQAAMPSFQPEAKALAERIIAQGADTSAGPGIHWELRELAKLLDGKTASVRK